MQHLNNDAAVSQDTVFFTYHGRIAASLFEGYRRLKINIFNVLPSWMLERSSHDEQKPAIKVICTEENIE